MEKVLLFSRLFSDCRYVPQLRRYSPTKLCDCAQMANFWRFLKISNRNTCFPGHTRFHNSNGISIGSAVFCWAQHCDRPTDRPTDHAARSVTIGRIYVRRTAMRRNNIGVLLFYFSRFHFCKFFVLVVRIRR